MRRAVYMGAAVVMLILLSFRITMAESQTNLAPINLTTEQWLQLETDVLAKAITQNKPIYLKHVLASRVQVGREDLSQDSATVRLLQEYGGLKLDFARTTPAELHAGAGARRKIGAVQFDSPDRASVRLQVVGIQEAEGLARRQHNVPIIVIGFGKLDESWQIVSVLEKKQ